LSESADGSAEASDTRPVTSNLRCLGLDAESQAELEALLRGVFPTAVRVGESQDGVVACRWTDDSGARLTLGIRDDAVADLVPSYDARPGVRVVGMSVLADEVVSADVVDADGELLTRMACELEQWRCLGEGSVAGTVAVTAFGIEVSVHTHEAAYATSPASLLTREDEGRPRGADVRPDADWPMRTASESFVSYGLFSGEGDSEPHAFAHLSGVVLAGSTKLNTQTGRAFHVARVRSVLGELDVCVPVSEQPETPVPGNVVSGLVYLVASIDELWGGVDAVPQPAPRKRRWFRR
jgi:hypothetical protein